MKKSLFVSFLLGAAVLFSCTDLKEIETRIESLDSRVTALENQVKALNQNVEAVSGLMEAGTIHSVTESDGVWTIELSDGRKLTLTQGSVGVGATPVMSVDADGYWMVDYGEGPAYVLKGNEKVKATGTNGVTPQFGVDANGYWIVSYDGGTTFQQVLGADNKPVSALPGEGQPAGDPFFKDVSYDGGVFTVVLKNDTVLKVPVVTGFLVSITGSDMPQVFAAGETKNFPVVLEGVAQTILTVPNGWTATLSETLLSVTAPLSTKAVIADTATDVSILGISTSGLVAVAKLKVSLDETPAPVNPAVVITPGETTVSTLSFTVLLSDATSWKYIVRETSAVAPSPEYVYESGIVGEGTGAIVEGLDEDTQYNVYVLPVNGELIGVLAKATMSTLAPVINDWYEAWNNGKDIVIAGLTYNKATNGDALLLSATEGELDIRSKIHQKESAILFLEQAEGASFIIGAVAEIKGTVLLMSRYADKPVTLKPKFFIKQTSGSIILKNLLCDLVYIDGSSSNSKYVFNNSADSSFDNWHMEDCRFLNVSRGILYSGSAGQGCSSIVVKNCDFQLITTANAQLFNLNKSTVLHTYKEIAFEGNVFYNTSAVPVQILNYNYETDQTGSPWDGTLTVKNNIFYNSPSTNSYFKFWQLASFKLQGNIFWADPEFGSQSYMFWLYSPDQSADALDFSDNITFGMGSGKYWQLGTPNSTVKPEPNRIDKLAENPFESFDTASGAYVLKEAYASYGPQR